MYFRLKVVTNWLIVILKKEKKYIIEIVGMIMEVKKLKWCYYTKMKMKVETWNWVQRKCKFEKPCQHAEMKNNRATNLHKNIGMQFLEFVIGSFVIFMIDQYY